VKSSKTQTSSSPGEPAPASVSPSGDRFEWSEHVSRWNVLAAEQGLKLVRPPLTEKRKKALRARLKDHPDYWELLIESVRARGAWAREQQLPTFDQATNPSFLQKLIEGNYGDRPTGGGSKPVPDWVTKGLNHVD